MNKLFGLIVAAGIALGFATPSLADTFPLGRNSGVFTPLNLGDEGTFTKTQTCVTLGCDSIIVPKLTNSRTDSYTFHLDVLANVYGVAVRTDNVSLKIVSLVLYDGLGNAILNTPGDTRYIAVSDTVGDRSYNYSHLASDNYTIKVTLQNLSGAQGIYKGGVTVSAVPLPATLPFLAAGLAGLGIFRRRRQDNVAA